jgi:hypothetical protein
LPGHRARQRIAHGLILNPSVHKALVALSLAFFMSSICSSRVSGAGGQQHVTVKHVTVNEGGQAIVGNVSHGGQGGGKNSVNPMHLAKRCKAHSKRTGLARRSPGMGDMSHARLHAAAVVREIQTVIRSTGLEPNKP